ncbi:MAG: hypothetical protein ABJB12_11205 [Pseudomonadota bacterium]
MMNACTRWSFLAVPVLAALGCSDPVPLPAEGAVTLGLQGPMQVTQTSCPVGAGRSYQVGFRAKDGSVQAPTEILPGKSVIDGENSTVVSCSVHKQSDGSYAFSGSLQAPSSEHDPINVTISNGLISSDGVTGTGAVSVFTPQLAGTFASGSTPCTFKVIKNQVKGGAIWASFSCPSIAQPPQNVCSIVSSIIVFGNCAGS